MELLPNQDPPKKPFSQTKSLKDPPSPKKPPLKKAIYQMQRPLDLSRVKPQNSWHVFKKLTITFKITPSTQLTQLDFIKELAPKAFEDLKENLSDLSMDHIKTPLPFLTTIKAPNNQEIELRYLAIDTQRFALESLDHEVSIEVIESKEEFLLYKRKTIEKVLAFVFLTENTVTAQQAVQETPELIPLTYVFDVNYPKESFTDLKAFVKARILVCHEKRVNSIEKRVKLAIPFEKLPFLALKVTNEKEIALNFAFLQNIKDKTRFLKNLKLKLGSPPDYLFDRFRKTIETLALGYLNEIKTRVVSQHKRVSPLKTSILGENHMLTAKEIKEIGVWALERVLFNDPHWKKELFLMLGCPKGEKTWRNLLGEIEGVIVSKKGGFQRKLLELYSQKDRIKKPLFHLGYLKKGYFIENTRELNGALAMYLVKHKHYHEITKETLKVLLGNPEAALKEPQKASELKLLETSLLAGLQRISDQRTSFTYIQQDQNPGLYKGSLMGDESGLARLKGSPFVKILLFYDQDCEKSQEIIRKSALGYKTKGKAVRVVLCRLNKEAFDEKEVKRRVLKEKPNEFLFLVSEFSLKTIEKVITMLFFYDFKGIKYTVFRFKVKGSGDETIPNWSKSDSLMAVQEIEEMEGVLGLKGAIGVSLSRSEGMGEIVKNGLLKGEVLDLNGMKGFLEDLASVCDSDVLKELFEGFPVEKARDLKELEGFIGKALLKLESAISQREMKAVELKGKLDAIQEPLCNGKPDHLALKLEGTYPKKAFFYILYDGKKTGLKEIKGRIKEKFLIPLKETLIPLEICVLSENSGFLESFKVEIEDFEGGIGGNSLEIKVRRVNLEEETYRINRKRAEKLGLANRGFLEKLYEFKYDFVGYFKGKTPEKDSDERVLKLREEIEGNQRVLEDLKEKLKENIKEKETFIKENPIKESTQNTPIKDFSFINERETRLNEAIARLEGLLEEKRKGFAMQSKANEGIRDLKGKIEGFFSESRFRKEDLVKLKDYFLHLQKGVLKFYTKALLIEADLFEMKKDAKKQLVKSGLAMIAGSIPFIGDILKTVVEKVADLKEKYDEMKLTNKCTKFCVLFNSTERLSEILEETAFLLINDKEKQEVIIGLDGFKDTFWSKLKEKILNFLKKTKEKLFGKGKPGKSKQSNLLKEIDTPAKLVANIDSAFICANAAMRIEREGTGMDQFNEEDIYNQKPLVGLFVRLAKEIGVGVYEKVLDMHEVKIEIEKEYIGKNLADLDKEIEVFEVKSQGQCIEEIKRQVLDGEIEGKEEMAMGIVEIKEAQLGLEELRKREEAFEGNLKAFEGMKGGVRGSLGVHLEKLDSLELKFEKILYGGKGKVLGLVEMKEEATVIEFEANEKIKALTRNAEAIREKIGFWDRYKEIFLKRKALK